MTARWSAVRRFALPAALAAALGLVAVLARQKAAQEKRYATLRENTTLPRRGVFVPTFVARTIKGDSIMIGERPDDGKQVLFLFTTTCPYCKASLRAVRELADAASTTPGVGMVGIVLDSLDHAIAYAHANALSFPIIEFPTRKLRYLYRARSVPTVLVLDADLEVESCSAGLECSTVDSQSIQSW